MGGPTTSAGALPGSPASAEDVQTVSSATADSLNAVFEPATAARDAVRDAKASGKSAAKRKNKAYRVPVGAYFNNPRGNWDERMRIERQVMKAIRATKKGATIRIALYSFDRIPVAQELLKARARGVRVQILLNDHQDTKAMKMLRAQLGTNVKKNNFIYKCQSSCRGASRKRFLHTKFYLFTKTGRSKWGVFVGSHNLTMNAMRHQWNDLYLLADDKALHDNYVTLFNDMKRDYRREQNRYPTFCGVPANGVECDDAIDNGTTVVFPRLVGPKNDPIVRILDRVQCITVNENGERVRTKLAVNMHTIRGRRGNYLADAYVKKFAEGCDARFSFGLVGAVTKQHLGKKTIRGRMPLRSTGFDYNPDSDPVPNPEGKVDLSLDYYSHQKFLIIDGNYAGNPNAKLVFTGSSNWGALGSVNDEILVSVIGRKAVRQYTKQFDFEWLPRNSRNAYTTTYTNFRQPVVRMGADGNKIVTYRTVTKEHVEIDDRFVYRPGANYGPHWEDD